ncbi:response regulator transcription factor [Kitasatospora sp. NPDC057500]|uniref:helix-turn-helix transcriptional regulator n=1 Tax=Kitasatospora sp. NPDC057500 TaxID=3346151 RepID=UPI00369A10E1
MYEIASVPLSRDPGRIAKIRFEVVATTMRLLPEDEDPWSFKAEAMTFLANVVNCSGVVFYSVDTRLNAVDHAFHRIRPVENRSYTAHYHRLDPFHPRRFAGPRRPLVTMRDLPERYERGEYYRRFMAPLGFRHEAELYLYSGARIVGGLSLLRTAELGDFAPADLGFLDKAHAFLEHTFQAGGGPVGTGPPVAAWGLTPREREVVRLVCEGASNAEIGAALFIGVTTVKTHVRHVFEKAGVRSRTQLIARLRGEG